jgi:hypothetical protein
MLPAVAASGISCPASLAWLCQSTCIMAHCLSPFTKVMADKTARARMIDLMGCTTKLNATDPQWPYDCMAPDNALVDDFMYCGVEQHPCLNASIPGGGPVYPTCADASVPGDDAFEVAHLAGDWYKVAGWKPGEAVECMDCQHVRMTLSSNESVSFASNWTMADRAGKQWLTSVTAAMGPRVPAGGPGKMFNAGRMFGLTFWEPYTVVHDGSQEEEPFMLFYACGGTLQGNYTAGFVLAKTPTASDALHARFIAAARKAGIQGDYCAVDNSCFAQPGA